VTPVIETGGTLLATVGAFLFDRRDAR